MILSIIPLKDDQKLPDPLSITADLTTCSIQHAEQRIKPYTLGGMVLNNKILPLYKLFLTIITSEVIHKNVSG